MAELDRSTLARNLKPLLNRGLVIDTRQPGARNRQLELTAAGQQTVAAAQTLWEKAQQKVQATLGEAGQAALEEVLAALAKL